MNTQTDQLDINELFDGTRDGTECAQDAGLDWEVRITAAVGTLFAAADVEEAGREEITSALTTLAAMRENGFDADEVCAGTPAGAIVARIVPDEEEDVVLVVVMTVAEAADGIALDLKPVCPQCHERGYLNGQCEVCGYDRHDAI